MPDLVQSTLVPLLPPADFARVEDEPNDTAKGYRAAGHKGTVGFISSMTDHFCGSCNRLR
jgi:molybdenum cofactor biosynthesis enzyme MoaA